MLSKTYKQEEKDLSSCIWHFNVWGLRVGEIMQFHDLFKQHCFRWCFRSHSSRPAVKPYPSSLKVENEDSDSKRIILPPLQDSINLCCQDPQNLTMRAQWSQFQRNTSAGYSSRLRSNNFLLSIQSDVGLSHVSLSCTKVTGRWISLLIQTLEDKSTKWGTACRKEDLLIHACRAVPLQKEPDR